MKKYLEYKQEIEFRELESITCDLCGITTNSGMWEGEIDGEYSKDIEVNIEMLDNDSDRSRSIDMCPDCFEMMFDLV